MGYIFLILSLVAGATKGYCGKRMSDYVAEYKEAMLANSIRMIFCVLIGFAMLVADKNISALKINYQTLMITLLSGIANSAFLVFWLISVKKGAYMMLDVFCMVGILIPMIGCAIFFNEKIGINHIIGVAILIVAVCIMCSYNNSIKSRLTVSSIILLIICGISNGMSDFSQKLFVNLTTGVPVAVYNFYTYLFSTVILIICYLFSVSRSENKERINIKPIFIYILIMSVCLFLNSYFKTVAAGILSSTQLYPLAQSGALILSSIMSAVFFGEKLNLKSVVGITMSFIALVIINV